MKVAVLMSTYNGEQYLDRQLQSLANQTVAENMDLYIRDDGSTDKTLDIIGRWKDTLKIVLIQGQNLGPAMSFWSMLISQEIKADYYAFCDQDDIWDKYKLEQGISQISQVDGAALWCSNCRIIDKEGKVIVDRMNKEIPIFTIPAQLVCGTTQGCAMVINNLLRDCIIKKRITVVPMHDFVVMTYAIAFGTVIYDERPFFSYRVHENNVVAKSGKKMLKRMANFASQLFSKSHKNELSNYAEEFLKINSDKMDAGVSNYMNDIVKSKSSIMYRIRVIKNPFSTADNRAALRSFRIRVLLGII